MYSFIILKIIIFTLFIITKLWPNLGVYFHKSTGIINNNWKKYGYPSNIWNMGLFIYDLATEDEPYG